MPPIMPPKRASTYFAVPPFDFSVSQRLRHYYFILLNQEKGGYPTLDELRRAVVIDDDLPSSTKGALVSKIDRKLRERPPAYRNEGIVINVRRGRSRSRSRSPNSRLRDFSQRKRKKTLSQKASKKFKVGKTRKKSVTYKDGTKGTRVSARREFDAGAKIGTRYKTPKGFKVLSLDYRGRPYLSNSIVKRRKAFSRKK